MKNEKKLLGFSFCINTLLRKFWCISSEFKLERKLFILEVWNTMYIVLVSCAIKTQVIFFYNFLWAVIKVVRVAEAESYFKKWTCIFFPTITYYFNTQINISNHSQVHIKPRSRIENLLNQILCVILSLLKFFWKLIKVGMSACKMWVLFQSKCDFISMSTATHPSSALPR